MNYLSEAKQILELCVQMLAAGAALISAIVGLLILRRQTGMHVMMNSRLSELQEQTKLASHAAGVIEGRVAEKLEGSGAPT